MFDAEDHDGVVERTSVFATFVPLLSPGAEAIVDGAVEPVEEEEYNEEGEDGKNDHSGELAG